MASRRYVRVHADSQWGSCTVVVSLSASDGVGFGRPKWPWRRTRVSWRWDPHMLIARRTPIPTMGKRISFGTQVSALCFVRSFIMLSAGWRDVWHVCLCLPTDDENTQYLYESYPKIISPLEGMYLLRMLSFTSCMFIIRVEYISQCYNVIYCI